MTKPLLKIGHRGAKGYAPENTLKSVRKAIELGVDMVELDVHVSLDGEVIVIHDEKLNRTTNGLGAVRKKSLAYIKSLNAGDEEQVPTLREVFDLIDKRIGINIELKGKFTLTPVLKLIEEYVHTKGWTYEHFIISTFSRKNLKRLSKLNHKVRIGALLARHPFGFIKFAKSIRAYSAHLSLKVTDPKIIKDAKQSGLKVYVWTVNEKEDIDRLKKLGVDGIFSDFPDRI
ncbi:MAG: glycerophosphodiester phosphodiesterase [Candidatus Omnitrophica bacterium]|nr:glycerophosphodiester phosphodiesterase [Candidatus Omnitrophota bacterium]